VTPALLLPALQRRFGQGAIFTTDSGNGTFLAMECLRLDHPGRFLGPIDYSCMGYSVPAAIGAKLACKDAPVIALAGDTEPARGGLRTPFFQETNFLYLTGWREPGAMLIMASEGDFLFIPKRDEIRDRYTGRKAAPEDPNIAAVTGFENVLESSAFASKLKALATEGRAVYGLPSTTIQNALPGRELQSAERPLARLRMIKSPAEIAHIQRSVDATIAAHLASWQRVKAGLYEYQVAATMGSTYFEQGCERHAYMPIVASGPMSISLHYSANKRRMDSGEVVDEVGRPRRDHGVAPLCARLRSTNAAMSSMRSKLSMSVSWASTSI
jgi:hypothetical protein